MTRSSTSEMRKLIASCYESEQSQTAFAPAHGISKGKLSYWVNKFLKEESKNPLKSNLFLYRPPFFPANILPEYAHPVRQWYRN